MLLVLLSGCGKSVPEELDSLCTIAGEVEADPEIPPEDRARRMAYRFMDVRPSRATRTILDETAQAEPAERWTRLKQRAADNGVPNYECAALERLFAPLAEEPDAASATGPTD